MKAHLPQYRFRCLRQQFAFAILAFIAGCASPTTPPSETPTNPPPSNFSIDLEATVNLTPPISAWTELPSSMRAILHAEANSKALATTPLSSHHDGHMTLLVKDETGSHTYVNISVHVQGDSEGTPTEGLGRAIGHFFDAASLMSRPLDSLSKPVK